MLFQFHEGPIKTDGHVYPQYTNIVMFQFHEGPIKTSKTTTMRLNLPMFQFHEGPIKTCLIILKHAFSIRVSIP